MSHNETICVIDDDSSIRWVLDKALGNAGLQVEGFDSADSALQAISKQEPAVIITDIRMPGMDGLELLERIQTQHPDIPVIIMTAHSDLDSAVAAYQSGAFEYQPIRAVLSSICRNRLMWMKPCHWSAGHWSCVPSKLPQSYRRQ